MPADPPRKTPPAIPSARPEEKYRERTLSLLSCPPPLPQPPASPPLPPRLPPPRDKSTSSPTRCSHQEMTGPSHLPPPTPPHNSSHPAAQFWSRSPRRAGRCGTSISCHLALQPPDTSTKATLPDQSLQR